MIWAVSMCKDEADVIEQTVTHMLGQVDVVLIADNGSTDGTRETLESLPVFVKDDAEVGYYQSQKMTALAHEAYARGAEWIVPFDADEVWRGIDGPIKFVLPRLPADAMICEAAVLDHVATDEEGLSPWRRPEQLPLRKVAVRAYDRLVIHQGNHGATFRGIEHPLRASGLLEVHHFPYRSPEQMISKARNGAAAYAATDLPEDVGAHWRGYGRLSDEQIREVFYEYFHSADPEADGLVHDPVIRCPSRS